MATTNSRNASDRIPDFMQYQRITLALSAQVFPRPVQYKFMPKIMVFVLQKLYFLFVISSFYHVTLMLFVTLWKTRKIGSFEEIVAIISTTVVYTLMPTKMVYFQIRSEKCNDLMDYMNRHFHTRSAKGLTYVDAVRSFEWGKKFTLGYIIFALMSVYQLVIDPLFATGRTLMINVWYPVDPLQSPAYEIIFFLQIVAQAMVAFSFCNTLIFSMGCSLAICTQFDILFCSLKNLQHTIILQEGRNMSPQDAQRLRTLQSRISLQDLKDDTSTFPFCYERLDDLLDLPNEKPARRMPGEKSAQPPRKTTTKTPYSWENSKNVSKIMHAIIRHHQHLIYCAEQLENIHNPVCLSKFLVLTLQLCILTLNMLEVSTITFNQRIGQFLYLVNTLFDSFFSAYSGQILLNQSQRVRDFLYQIPWYEMSPEVRRELCLVQLKSQKPLTMTGGKFFVLSYETFIAMIKTAFSYYTLLSQKD